MRCRIWCHWCYEAMKGRAPHKGHFGYQKRVGKAIYYGESPMKRPVDVGGGAGGKDPVACEALSKLYPCLLEQLTVTLWDDGKKRERSSVTLVVTDGVLHGSLNEKSLGRSFWKSGRSVGDVLASLEKALADGSAEWRSWKK